MAYKLYINNKLFNGIGNNNYNKGTIAINGTVYQYDNSSSSVTQFNIYYHYLQPESQAVNTYTVNDIPTMTNTDYLLDGYYYDSSFTTPVTAGDIVNKDTDIYLNWISKTYLYKVVGTYEKVNIDLLPTINTKYISQFYFLYKSGSQYAQLNNNTVNKSYTNSENETIEFNGYIFSESRNNASQLKTNDDRRAIITPAMNGRLKFYYRAGGSSDTGNSYISTSSGGKLCITQTSHSNIPASNYVVDNNAPQEYTANTIYESMYFTVSANQQYYVFLNSTTTTTPRLILYGFKFVAD